MRDRAADFGGGVVDTLSDRAQDVGKLAYEALTSDPAIGRMTTAEFSQAAANRPSTPRLDATAQGIGAMGKALVTQPVQTAKAVVVDPVVEAFESPRAMGQFAGEFVNPLRIAAALRKTAPIAEIDAYHGTADDFEAFDPKMGGRATGAESGRQATWFTDDPRVAKGYAVYAAEMGPYNRKMAEAKKLEAQLDIIDDPKLKREASKEYYRLVREAGELEENAYARREANARLLEVDIPDNTKMLVIDAKGKTPFELSMNEDTDSWLKAQLERAKRLKKQGVQIKNLDDAAGLADAPATHYAVFDPSGVKIKSKVRILERDGQKASPQKIAQALEAAPTLSVMEQRIKERFGDFAQAYNLGLPDTPEYRRIVQEVTAQGPLSDDALRESVKLHPAYLQAGGKSSAAGLRQENKGGAASLVDSLSGQGIKTRVETSKSPGSRSTYIYASKGDKTVKIRLSDHLPAESGRVYGANDIMTTPQHWKSAAKRALKLLGEEK